MEDVIFSGTADRPSRNNAEVTIYLDNEDRRKNRIRELSKIPFKPESSEQVKRANERKRQDDIAKARPKMIAFLDTLRHTLEELSSDLGVTDPHSGTVVIEK